MNLRSIVTVSLAVVAAQEAQLPLQYPPAPPLPDRTTVEFIDEDQLYRIEFVHELINDPDVSLVFNVPGHTAIGTDGRQYYVDSGDRTVHVLDEAGSHIVDIGGEGQGPGEF